MRIHADVHRTADRIELIAAGIVVRFPVRLVRAPQSLWVWPNDVLLDELRRVLGAENVAVVE